MTNRPNLSPRRTARRSQRKSPTWMALRGSGRFHRPQCQGPGSCSRRSMSLSPRRPDSARRKKPSSSPNPAAPRTTCCACLADSAVGRRHRAVQRLQHRRAFEADLRRIGSSATKAADRVTGSRTADMRSALVDYFREQGRIMIATEAGAEGINLQFCSLVVNYDLPWNPAAHRATHRPLPPLRPEARRGGGQLSQPEERGRPAGLSSCSPKSSSSSKASSAPATRFSGAIESGVDFEKRIAAIYQKCREPERNQGGLRRSCSSNSASRSTRP